MPEGANVSVTNSAGEKVHNGATPLTLTLKRGAGYFKSERYTIAYSKAGFAPKEVTITGSMSGWYIGNILFGGLIGMLAVDPVTGAMYVLPDTVSQSLDAEAPKTSAGRRLAEGRLDRQPDAGANERSAPARRHRQVSQRVFCWLARCAGLVPAHCFCGPHPRAPMPATSAPSRTKFSSPPYTSMRRATRSPSRSAHLAQRRKRFAEHRCGRP